MPIDASIPLQVRPYQAPDQLSQLAKMLQLQNASQGVQLGQLQYQKLQGDMAKEHDTGIALSALVRDPANIASRAELASKNPAAYEQFVKAESEAAKAQAAIAKDRAQTVVFGLEADEKKAQQMVNIIKSGTDQTTWEMALASLKSRFGDGAVANLPVKFDPVFVKAKTEEGISVEKSLHQKLENAKFEADKLHKAALESVAEYNAKSSRISAQASASQAGTAAARLGFERTKFEAEKNLPEGAPFEVSDAKTGRKVLVARSKQGELLDANTRKPIDFEAGPKGQDVTPEGAGKVALMKQARQDIEEAKGILFDKQGDLKRGTLAATNVVSGGGNIPFSDVGEQARLAYTRVRNAVAAKLRIETGAAAPESEVTEIARRFLPSAIQDTSVSAKDKLDRLQEFMDMSLKELERSGYTTPGTAGSTRKPKVNPADFGLKPKVTRG